MSLIEKLSQITSFSIQKKDNEIYFELNIEAHPAAKKEKIIIDSDKKIKLYFKERPVDGAANSAIEKILKKKLGTSQVLILRGEKNKAKTIAVKLHLSEHKGEDFYIEKINDLLMLQE